MAKKIASALSASLAEALAEALRGFRAAFANRGQTTSIAAWDRGLREADRIAAEALATLDAAQKAEDMRP